LPEESQQFFGNLPKIGTNLNSLGAKVGLLEMETPASNLDPFMGLDNPLEGARRSKISFVPQQDFDKSMVDIKDAFKGVKEALQQQSGGAAAPTGLSLKVDMALRHLGEIEGRVTGEYFLMSNQTFSSKNEAIEWLAAKKVPS
jgi:hypothetical protein